MKRYIMLIFLFLIAIEVTHGQDNPSGECKKWHVADIYQQPEVLHLRDNTMYSADVIGDASNDIAYSFTIRNRSTLFMANMMGSQFEETNMYLLYRPLNSRESFTIIEDAMYDSHKVVKALADKDKFIFKFEEDLTQIPYSSSLLYETLIPGEYELYCEATETVRGRNGDLKTNIYFSPLGVEQNYPIDLVNDQRILDKKMIAGTFSSGDVYYNFRLDTLTRIDIVHNGPLSLKPVIKLEGEYSLLTTSQDHPLKDDSIPQIKDFTCSKGKYNVCVSYQADSIFGKAGLEMTGVIDDTGDRWEKPFEMGSYSDSIRYTHNYSLSMFAHSSAPGASGNVYHRFEIKDTMDVSISTSNYGVKGITLYDNHQKVLLYENEDEYQTALDAFHLLPGVYVFKTEGNAARLKINVSGQKTLCQLPDKKNYVTTVKANMNTPFLTDLINPRHAGQDIRYADAFGRIEQKVELGVTPLLKDLVTTTEFDKMYRDSCSWLAVPHQGMGAYLPLPSVTSFSRKEYGDDFAYEKSYYEDSPSNRVTEKYLPGKDWQAAEHSQRTNYLTNTSADRCRIFGVKGTKDSTVLVCGGFYPAKELEVAKSTDEAGCITYVFTDKLGQQILSRAINGTDTLDTYQVYDDFGNVCYVLPPMAVDRMSSLGMEKALDLYAYQYHYDQRNFFRGKKMPGTGWTEYRYNRKGRLLCIRDEEIRKQGKWKMLFYDRMGREVMTAIYQAPSLANVSWDTDFSLTSSHALYGYAISSDMNLKNVHVQKVIYYDNYDYKKVNPHFTEEFDYQDDPSYGHRYGDDDDMFHCKGQQTGVMNCVVGTEQMLGVSTYYDYYQRPVQVRSIDINGNMHVENTGYDFASHITASTSGIKEFSYAKDMAYDHAGRLVKSTEGLNDKVKVISSYEYDELGRLKAVTRGNGKKSQTVTNHYNLRGWLTSTESPLFSQNLYYTDGVGTPCYNGNISSMDWRTNAGTDVRGYRFEYDSLSRVKNAAYGEGAGLSLNPFRFDEQITDYDKNGNITGLKRYGQTAAGNYGLMDNLTITLNGNHLQRVSDSVAAFADGFEFKDRAKQDVEYLYDANGNLVKDLNKKITNIQYNYLNLPDRIEFEDGSYISYLYDATGVKLRVMHHIAGEVTTTDYCGNLIYENGNPKMLLTDAGFISLNDYKCHYYVQDHQGNNRVVADEDGNVEERNDYYPFGGLMSSSTGSVQNYKYNGKELDRKGGLDWYDYGARMYDAAIGRWNAMDPMSEKYYYGSPYTYCKDNPVSRIDPDGKDDYVLNYNGQIVFMRKTDRKVDVLYASGTKGGVSEIKPEWNNIRVFDKTILPTFYKNRASKSKPLLFAETAHISDAARILLFGVENTGVEWSYRAGQRNGKKSYIIGNSGSEYSVSTLESMNNLFEGFQTVVDIHSHPSTPGAYGNDMPNAKGKDNTTFGVYYKGDKTIYEYNSVNSNLNSIKIPSLLDLMKYTFQQYNKRR